MHHEEKEGMGCTATANHPDVFTSIQEVPQRAASTGLIRCFPKSSSSASANAQTPTARKTASNAPDAKRDIESGRATTQSRTQWPGLKCPNPAGLYISSQSGISRAHAMFAKSSRKNHPRYA